MSKTVKNYMIRDYKSRLGDISDALVISVRGVPGKDDNRMRVDLAKKNIRITVVRNSLVRHSAKGSTLANIEPLLSGPSALAFGGESVVDVARALVDWAGKIQQLELKGAVLDGVLFSGKKGVEELSKYPTRNEAIAQSVTLVLSPARNLLGQIGGPAGKVAGIIKSIESKLEKGETIAKVG